jgi:hypothetical protein
MDEEKWIKHYQTCDINAVWVKVMTSDGKHFFFSDYKVWQEVKSHCEKNFVFIEDLHLQFRSHKCIMDVRNAKGLYLVRSVMGTMGGPSANYYTVGVLKGKEVHKQMWLVPELIMEKEMVDDPDQCFEEAMIFNEKKKTNRKKQVQT